MSLTTTQQHFTKFYLAAFLRAPDLGGLNYWANEVQSGKSLQEVGGVIFSLPIVTDIYPSNLSDHAFVEAIYHNVFGRNSDAEGLNYWSNEIATLRNSLIAQGHDAAFAAYEARGQLTINMINAGLGTPDGTDGKAYIVNRLSVAEYAAEQQLTQGEEIPAIALLDIFKNVNATDASVTVAKTEITDELGHSMLRNGKVITDFGAGDDVAHSLIQQTDGKLLVAGWTDEDDGTHENFALARYNADGTLDVSFGGDGKVTTDFALIVGSTAFSLYDEAYSLIQQTDGKLVVAGYSSSEFALARYNLDGSLDTSFGGGDGKITTDFFGGNFDEAYSLIQQADGKLLVAGYTFFSNGYDFAMARYNPDGSLDTSFGGGDGMVRKDFGGQWNQAYSLIQQVDGKLVLAGGGADNFAVVRYNLDGSLDKTFGGGDGMVTTDFGGFYQSGRDLIQQTDGKLVVAGGNTLVRYNPDGTLDSSFGINGAQRTFFDNAPYYSRSLIQQTDGKLVVAGWIEAGNDYGNDNFVLLRYNLDGSLDTSFGGEYGAVMLDFDGSDDKAYSLIQQADGKLVVAGEAFSDGVKFALARYNSDGTLDTSFGAEVMGTTSFRVNSTYTDGGESVELIGTINNVDSDYLFA